MGILSTGSVRRIRFRHYGLLLIIHRYFNVEYIIARNVANQGIFHRQMQRAFIIHDKLKKKKKQFVQNLFP